jgi:fatty acid amide hydrolase 2
MNELYTLPAHVIAAMIRRGAVSSTEVVNAHIARLEQVDGALNALVEDRFADARREAAAADARRAADGPGDLPPLHGVPCTIKEFLAVDGMSWTAGIVCRRDQRARGDATVVARLRAAGAIILGVSNVPEGGMWMETDNAIFGRTVNPWDPARTSGGSSGGEGALLAAGAAPFGIGSDIAGSIRIPAAFCGVVGHKPTSLLVPTTGHWGPGTAAAERMLSVGPMGRTVRDLELVMGIIAGPDGTSAVDRRWPDGPAEPHDDLRGVTVVPVVDHAGIRPAPEVARQVERAAAALAERGATVRPLDVATWRRAFGRTFAVWSRAMTAATGEGPTFSELIGGGRRISVVAEAVRTAVGRRRMIPATIGLIALERLAHVPFGDRLLALAPEVADVQRTLEDLLGDRGVLLHPPYPRPAPRHHAALLRPFDFVYTALFNLVGFPVTAVPTGFDRGGVPLGVQIAARRGNDPLTLRVGRAVEDALGGWRIAPVRAAG